MASFHYNVDLEGEESYSNAAQITALEERNKKLLAQVDKLEDTLASAEEYRIKLQRQLLVVSNLMYITELSVRETVGFQLTEY